jgi:hypothetical protein
MGTPTHELQKPFTCLQCESSIEMVADVQNPQPVKKNNIVICWNCAALHKVGDGGLVRFKKQEFAKLDAQSKNLIAMTVTSILKRNARESKQ